MTHPYAALTPEVVLDAGEAAGLRPDGRLLPLNSYENRVYQVWLEDGSARVLKFYRPGRWTPEQIEEEHAFARQLAAREVPVVAPVHTGVHAGFRFALYPRRGGRAPNLDDPKVLEWIGRFIGRIHAVGASAPFQFRPSLNLETFGLEPRAFLLDNNFLPADLLEAWKAATAQALAAVQRCFENAGKTRSIRLHGDCHSGNVLWTDDGPHFVDLDDCRNGPAVQDLWMLLSGDRAAQSGQLSDLLAGYEDFVDFDRRELRLIEALRTLRQVHYSAWLARRWDDPAFPAAFPWFGSSAYWSEQVTRLREQVETMQEPPLVV